MSNENPAGLPSIPVRARTDQADTGKRGKDRRPASRRGGLRGKGAALIAAFVTGLLGFGVILFVLVSQQPDTVQGYRTTTALAVNQLVTTADIEAVDLPAADAPAGLMTADQLEANLWFAQVGMPAGTPLTSVVLGTKTRTNIPLPAGMVIASFETDPASAVAGKVQPGDYVNITAVGKNASDQQVARTILNHILVLDVNVNPQTISQSASSGVDESAMPGPSNPKVYGGIPSLYTVAVTNEQAATLALARNMSLYVTLTTADATGELNVSVTESQVFGGTPVPAGESLTGLTPTAPAEPTDAAPAVPSEAPTAVPSEAPAPSADPSPSVLN